ncbi:MAG TPA: hypothetical protein VFR37_08830 [Longimicrobium sp.]|nr:hypothetical protein [Longimicrobium sp.]
MIHPPAPPVPVAPPAPAALAPPVAPAAEAGPRWQPAAVAGVAFGGAAVLNLGWIPGVVVSHWVPLFLLASGCMAALRIRRAGVRRELRSHAAAKIAQFGGGVYGAMAAATLVQLETADLVDDVASAGSLSKFIALVDVDWMMAQLMESIGFAVSAATWPWHWFGTYGFVAVGLGYGVDALLKSASPRYRALREKLAVPAGA